MEHSTTPALHYLRYIAQIKRALSTPYPYENDEKILFSREIDDLFSTVLIFFGTVTGKLDTETLGFASSM
ncbi:hypothetical protein LJR034_005282 [Caballeronia sp. LjRoot34]|uniref:hypothetical protein n=1 Tax=Caballeronia sp. LjRoot34 TaxID=3342325 RepID=UPI003ECC32CA